jgi:F1F0 ATPase subunit 2
VDVEVLPFILAFATGMALGGWFFGGLWVTVRRIPTASSPALLALGSFWLRLAVCALGFYAMMGGQWERVLVCLFGFLGMRYVLVWYWRPERQPVATAGGRGR